MHRHQVQPPHQPYHYHKISNIKIETNNNFIIYTNIQTRMGLDCYIILTQEQKNLLPLFQKIDDEYCVIGYGVSHEPSEDTGTYYISFRGKAYAGFIHKNTEHSLYTDITHIEAIDICAKLEQIQKRFEMWYHDDDEIEKMQQVFAVMQSWVDACIDMYLPSPDEVKGLLELFKLVAEHHLVLRPSY